MKVRANSRVNLGDTSFRLQNYIRPTKIVLKVMKKYINKSNKWITEPKSFEDFIYNEAIKDLNKEGLCENRSDNLPSIMDDDKLLTEKEQLKKDPSLLKNLEMSKSSFNNKISKIGNRGRTLTNYLKKVGFVDPNRRLSETADNWLLNKSLKRDKLEKALPITNDNLIFLRQLLKVRLYKSDNKHFIRLLVFVIKFLQANNGEVKEKDFHKILMGLNPDTMDKDYINGVIDNYSKIPFKQYYDKMFPKSIRFSKKYINNNETLKKKSKKVLDKVSLAETDSWNLFRDKACFKEVFKNGKSKDAIPKYFEFVYYLMQYRYYNNSRHNVPSNLIDNLINASNNKYVKKAFGKGKQIFPLLKSEDFQDKYAKSKFLTGDPVNIYIKFFKSKEYDEDREYADMNRRILSLCGILNIVHNGMIKLNYPDMWSQIFANSDEDRTKICGVGNIKYYDKDINSRLYKDLSIENILDVSNVDSIITSEEKKQHCSSLPELNNKLKLEDENNFEAFIRKNFPESTVIKLLKDMIRRYNYEEDYDKSDQLKVDKRIQDKVMKQTDVPTIFEYVLGLAWYYLSDKSINILPAYHLTMANFRPVSHAPGNTGDITIKDKNFVLMLEATLMDPNAQKRGELEPVIRHSVNLKSKLLNEDCNNKTQTLFVADKCDLNVSNVFHDMLHVQLNNSNPSNNKSKLNNAVNGVKIFPLNIHQLIKLMKSPKFNSKDVIHIIYKGLDNDFKNNTSNSSITTKNDWQKTIDDKLNI